jgi:8-amino-7-oxononanoate synthase
VDWFMSVSETRVHCSPPPAAVVRGAERALEINAHKGDELRRRVFELVRRFRRRLDEVGLQAAGGLFPVQTLAAPGLQGLNVHQMLLQRGIRTVVLRNTNRDNEATIALLITARHSSADIDRVAAALSEVSIGFAMKSRRRLAKLRPSLPGGFHD